MANENDYRAHAERLANSPEEVVHLANWLQERKDSFSLKDLDVNSGLLRLDYDTVLCPKPGQLRALTSDAILGFDGCLGVAVLCKWDDDMWIVAPFSPYSDPAVHGECSAGIDFNGLRILQLWNCRSVQDAILGTLPLLSLRDDFVELPGASEEHISDPGFRVKNTRRFVSLSEKVLSGARTLFYKELWGSSAADGYMSGVLADSDDPRIEYVDEAIVRVDSLTNAVVGLYELGYLGGIADGLPATVSGRNYWVAAMWKRPKHSVNRIPKTWIFFAVLVLALVYAIIKEWLFGGV